MGGGFAEREDDLGEGKNVKQDIPVFHHWNGDRYIEITEEAYKKITEEGDTERDTEGDTEEHRARTLCTCHPWYRNDQQYFKCTACTARLDQPALKAAAPTAAARPAADTAAEARQKAAAAAKKTTTKKATTKVTTKKVTTKVTMEVTTIPDFPNMDPEYVYSSEKGMK